MKPDAHQDELLKRYLRKVFLYRETYEEVYDHIVSALQHQPNTGSFESQVNSIICNDFGGHNNLKRMEENCKKAIIKEGRRQLLNNFQSFFKFPNLLYVSISSVVVYVILTLIPLSPFNLNLLFIGLAIIPNFAVPVRYFFTGYFFGDTKKSVRDAMMGNWGLLLFRLFCAWNILLLVNKTFFTWRSPHPFYIMVGVMLFALYTLAFFKLNKDEFKVSVIK